MLIQTFPPRLMCRVMAIRAASICRLVTYECSIAWMPNSPKLTLVPPVAAPVRCGRCCLRCLTLRGISILVFHRRWRFGGCRWRGANRSFGTACAASLAPLAGGGAAAAVRPSATVRPVASAAGAAVVALVRGAQGSLGRLCLASGTAGRRLALVDPHLHANPAEGRASLVQTEVDVGAQRVQRYPALAVKLAPRHFGTAQASRALHPDALGAALHRALH